MILVRVIIITMMVIIIIHVRRVYTGKTVGRYAQRYYVGVRAHSRNNNNHSSAAIANADDGVFAGWVAERNTLLYGNKNHNRSLYLLCTHIYTRVCGARYAERIATFVSTFLIRFFPHPGHRLFVSIVISPPRPINSARQRPCRTRHRYSAGVRVLRDIRRGPRFHDRLLSPFAPLRTALRATNRTVAAGETVSCASYDKSETAPRSSFPKILNGVFFSFRIFFSSPETSFLRKRNNKKQNEKNGNTRTYAFIPRRILVFARHPPREVL